jgi:hypothetical protein
MKKLTAANSKVLAAVKKLMNSKIYKQFTQILNEKGMPEARNYLGQFFSPSCREEYLKQLVDDNS